ncbi:MAG: hypothetical protein ACK4UJ_08820 [Leptonema sp. (in: bacteria)]
MEFSSCKLKALVLTKDFEIIKIVSYLLSTRNIVTYSSSNVEELNNEYCLIIVGSDIDTHLVVERLRKIKGILPNVIFLENGNYNFFNTPYLPCKCKRVLLPMGILNLEQHIDEVLNLHYS